MILIATELKLLRHFRVWLRIFLETLLVIASHLLHLASLFLFSPDVANRGIMTMHICTLELWATFDLLEVC